MSPTSEPSITDKKKWYKQFWPWFLITIPVCSMILSFNMLRFAFDGQDAMVVDDYYKQGKGAPQTGAALRLAFYHVTQAPKDQTIDLFRDAQGIYRGSAENDLTGKWQVALLPHDQVWKVQQTLSFPSNDSIAFNP